MIAGSAILISFKIPNNEVYVEDPVKFIAMNAEIGGKISK